MKRFNIVENGYDINEVNRFIDIVIGRLEKMSSENTIYKNKIDDLNRELKEKNINSQKIEKALLAVEDTNERIRENAKMEANIILEEAKNNANSIVHEALIRAEKIEHERLILEKNMKVYKERVKAYIEAQLKIADELDKYSL